MSKQSRQRMRDAAGQRGSGKRSRWVLAIILAGIVIGGFAIWKKRPSTANVAGTDGHNSVTAKFPPTSFAELCALETNDLERCDIALMNLLCAEGLVGSEHLNISSNLTLLDNFAKYVKSETERHLYKFREHPDEFNNSEGYFRMMMMTTVLQQDLGVRYNPERIQLPWNPIESNERFFADSRDIFIHGLARKNGTGTCSSMPVFFVAVGRRLGYPLKLVRAKSHLFARWDEAGRSFNIEGTSIGLVSYPDNHYRNWPMSFTPEEEEAESYLKSLTPVQELTVFLSIRGACLRAHTNYLHALGAFAQAFYKEPQSVGYQKLFANAEYEAYHAGVLDKRAALQFAIHSLEIPPGPRAAEFSERKATLNFKNEKGIAASEIERELEILRAEISSSREKTYLQNEPNPLKSLLSPQNSVP